MFTYPNMDDKQFFVNPGNKDFKTRQKDVFDILAVYEKDVNLAKNKPTKEVDEEYRRHRDKKNRKTTKALRGQESIFKVPGSPPLRPKMPDFRRNPGRWTKYTLADVNPSDMSDASNTAAAMDFLRSRTPQMETDSPPKKINFRARTETPENTPIEQKPAFGKICEPIEEAPPPPRPVFLQSKLVMPEYVVGQKKAKAKKTRAPKQTTTELTLSHLIEED